MSSFIERALAERRTLEQAVAELRLRNAREPRPELTEMICKGEAEIQDQSGASRPEVRRL